MTTLPKNGKRRPLPAAKGKPETILGESLANAGTGAVARYTERIREAYSGAPAPDILMENAVPPAASEEKPEAPVSAEAQDDAPQSADPIARQAAAAYDPMKHWRAEALKGLIIVGVFSAFVNLLMLTMPIYLFQLSDRVLTSRSLETLLMLSIVAAGLLAVLSALDILRRNVLGRLSLTMETILGGPILASIVAAAPTGEGGTTFPLRCLQNVRSFIASPTMLLLFDAPLAPLFSPSFS